ncbi:hypothetical protein M9H77_08049 [Catharanthus roseus]|uniref:Uncharacterized protein n=1 Tax=Catharanthus roseus TaxID=4058 RepID=A0ACC0BWZ3_CATRO|nr:hypothetical protein M9H77_08049 [Catharanthus roseus]
MHIYSVRKRTADGRYKACGKASLLDLKNRCIEDPIPYQYLSEEAGFLDDEEGKTSKGKGVKLEKNERCVEKVSIERKERIVERLSIFESISILSRDGEEDECSKEKLDQKENKCLFEKQESSKEEKSEKVLMALEKREEVNLFVNHTISFLARNFLFEQDFGAPSKNEDRRLVCDSIKTTSFFPSKSYLGVPICKLSKLILELSSRVLVLSKSYIPSSASHANASTGFIMQVSMLQSQVAMSFTLTGISLLH